MVRESGVQSQCLIINSKAQSSTDILIGGVYTMRFTCRPTNDFCSEKNYKIKLLTLNQACFITILRTVKRDIAHLTSTSFLELEAASS